ncbi:ATP-binding protein [Geodermatophilus sp. SYSU D00691]
MTSTQTTSGAALVGRTGELAVLDRRVSETVAGRGGLVLLAGEPGIGKSRLAEEAGRRATGQGCRVVWGRCRETEGAPAFWPWTQVLQVVLADPGAAVPDELRPLLERRSAVPRQADRFRLFDAVLARLCACAARQPLVLVLDDLHRADAASLRLLDFVVPAARDVPLLLIGTYRDTAVRAPHPLAALVGERVGAAGTDHLALGGLGEEDVARLVAVLAPAGGALPLADLQRRSDGNPFFLTELLRLRPEEGAAVPTTVSAAIAARVRRLPAATRRLLELAAVVGRECSVRLLEVLGGVPGERVEARLAAAVDSGLLQAGASGYRFPHVLVRDALYAAIPPVRRAALHGRVVTALTAAGAESGAGDLASHAARAVRTPEDRQRARRLAEEAAEEALGRLAHEEAAAWYERALGLGPEGPEERFALLMALGASAGGASLVPLSRAAYDEAWQLARASGRADRLAQVALGLGAVVDAPGTVDAELVHQLEESLARADPAAREVRIRLAARLAVAVYWGPRLPEARRIASDAVAAARRLGDRGALAVALSAQQYALRGPGHLAERARLGEELVGHARALGDEPLEVQARRLLLADRWQQDLAAVDADLRDLDVLARETRRPVARWHVMVNECVRAGLAGRPEEGLELVDRTEAFGRRIGAHPAAMYGVGQRFFLLRQCGRGAEAEEQVRETVLAYPRVVTFRCSLALLLAEAGRRDEAEALLGELAADGCRAVPPDALWLSGVAQLALAAVRLGRRAEAETLHRLLLPHSGAVVIEGVVVWWGAVDHYLGLTAAALGREDEAERLLRSGLRQHEAWAAVPWIRASLDALAALPGRGGHVPERAPAALTDREREVLRLLAEGAANKQIARRLAISVHTVERHVTNVYSKIGARNRAEATAFALRRSG